jgi:hypothetical protein
MRRILALLLVLATLAGAIYTLWTWKGPGTTATDPWDAVPQHAAIVVYVPQAWSTWDRATHTTQLWGAFANAPGVAAAGRLLDRLALRLENDAALRNTVGDGPVLVAIMRSGGDRMGSLFVGTRNGEGQPADQALAEVLGADAATLQALATGGSVQVRPDTALPPLSLALHNGLWLLASDPGIMDEALLQLKGGTSLATDSLLSKARSTLGAGADAHILAHSARAQRLLNTWWRPDALERMEVPAGWVALDLRIRPDALLMSGLLVPESDDAVLATVRAQGNGSNNVQRMLPAKVSTARMWHVSDAAKWIEGLPAGAKADPATEALCSWVSGTVGTATAPGTDPASDLYWAFFGTQDSTLAVERLNSLCTTACDTLAYRGARLTRMPEASTHERVLGKDFAALATPWWVVLGDVILFSNTPAALMSSIDVWNDGGSLAEDERAAAWNARLSAEAGRTLWCDVARTRGLLQRGLKPDAAVGAMAMDSLWNALGGLTLQLSAGQHGYYHVVLGLQHAPLAAQAGSTAWSVALGAPVQRPPDLVRNHVNNTREVLVQDAQHRLHLLASTGQVLWTRQLEGPILGRITQVDRFRNDKLQYLFNTANTVFLVDRNGKDVGGFPFTLKSPATAPLAVFDYENERDYRVLVPTADKRLVNLGLDGQVVKGWEAKPLSAAATGLVRHLRIKGRDHLVVPTADGKLHCLDRRGVVRERFTLETGASSVVLALAPGPELLSSSLLWSDAEGRIRTGTLGGNKEQVAPTGTGHAVLLPPTDGTTGQVAYISGDSVILKGAGDARLLRSFGNPMDHGLQVYGRGTAGLWIVVASNDGSTVSLLDTEGREQEGSPFAGKLSAEPTDLDLDGRLELVTVSADGVVYAHRLNGKSNTLP